MGQISLSIPVTGQPNTTEDPKVASDLTTIQTVINGNLDDTNFASPNNAVFRLLFQASGLFTSTQAAGGTYFIGDGLLPNQSATGVGAGNSFPMWFPNAGGEFNVANKTAKGQVRVSLATNAVAPTCTYTVALYPIGSLAGTSSQLIITLGSSVGSSTVAFASPPASSVQENHSSTFTLPTVSTPHMLAVLVTGAPATGSATLISAQLYGFNA